MSNKQEYIDFILWGGLAAMGGIARFLSSRLSVDAPILTRRQFWFQAFANCFISWFAGIMGGNVFDAMGLDPQWAWGAAGVFGFMGAKGLEILADKFSNKIE